MADRRGGRLNIEQFIEKWRASGGSETANTQSFVNELCELLGVDPPGASQSDDRLNDYVYERRVFQTEADGSTSYGRIDLYKRSCFVFEAKQGSDADAQAAQNGLADLDLFGQTAEQRLKRGTARRGTPSWTKAMVEARGQAERYAKALPIDHGWPPVLIVADIGHCIDVYADFSGTGKQYVQFPDAARYRIKLDDLRDENVRARLRAIWTEPLSLDPSKEAARVTREIAEALAELSKRLEAREHNPTRVADFLMRCLFTMFAEDTGSKTEKLIPEGSFTKLLEKVRTRPENLRPALADLWAKMDKGGFVGMLGDAGETVRRFNGYLFKDQTVIELTADEIGLLIKASSRKWDHVEPAIFGTLLERALDGRERSKLGAHYTPRAYVERLVAPTIMEPLRGEWIGVQAAVAKLIADGKADEAKAEVERFHGKLAQTKVLDPACGTGNFLYVAMARMKELEGEVVSLLTELGDTQYVAELSGHTITPENFLGIEINPRAAAIAQLVLWIGYLQWHFRVNGDGRMPAEPVLRDVRTIENRDALIEWDDRVLGRDEAGNPVTRWDGETMKKHPVTGKDVPDETARVEVCRYVNPRPAKWPRADFIVGNPPFIGVRRMRQRLGDGYVDALRKAYPKLPADIDFVIYWWKRGADTVARHGAIHSGLVTTNSLGQLAGQSVIREALAGKASVSIVFVIADHPWRDSETDAAVRITMTVLASGKQVGTALEVDDSPTAAVVNQRKGTVQANLTIGAKIADASTLRANAGLGFMGVKLAGDGFRINVSERASLLASGVPIQLLPRLLAGADVTRRPQERYVIDAFGMSEEEFRKCAPAAYQHLLTHVYPKRRESAVRSTTSDAMEYARNWWLFAKCRPKLRIALGSLGRCIITSEVSKHSVFVFSETNAMQFDGSLIVIAHDDAFVLGLLSSQAHVIWKLAAGGTLEDRPRYQLSNCFDPFPFPHTEDDALKARIRNAAEALDALRRDVLAKHPDLTVTKLYNTLEALRVAEAAGAVLSEKDRDLAVRGCVSLIRQYHDEIDAAVAEAYGWPANLSDEQILERLVALNKERAAEEARGKVRWLRPDFQAPGYAAPAEAQQLDLGGTAAPEAAEVIAWPGSLPEQVVAVANIVDRAGKPMAANDIARAFKGKRAPSVLPVLDALAGMGRVRKLANGRYAR